MLIKELYKVSETYSNKNNNGNVFGPDEFNDVLKAVTPDFFKKKAEQIQQQFGSFSRGLMSSKLLREFRASESITPTVGVYNLTGLSNTFFSWVTANVTTVTSTGRYPKVSLVTDDQWETIKGSLIGAPSAEYPIARIVGNSLEVLPTTTGEINLVYIKFPTIPKLDYYIDANDNRVFLAAGATGVSVPAGGTSSAGTSGPTSVDSSTVEIPFSADYHQEFMLEVLLAMGVKIESGMITNFVNQEQQKENQL